MLIRVIADNDFIINDQILETIICSLKK